MIEGCTLMIPQYLPKYYPTCTEEEGGRFVPPIDVQFVRLLYRGLNVKVLPADYRPMPLRLAAISAVNTDRSCPPG